MQCGTAPPTAKAIGSGSSGGSDAIGGGEENIIDVTAYEEEIEELEEELEKGEKQKMYKKGFSPWGSWAFLTKPNPPRPPRVVVDLDRG